MSTLAEYLSHPKRSVPEILPEWRPFFEACRESRLDIERCVECRRPQFYPRGQCTACGGAVEPMTCSGRGTIYSVTTVRMNRDPAFEALVPYNLGMIELPEGVKMQGAIFGDAPKIGDEVEAKFGELAGSGIWAAVWQVVGKEGTGDAV